MSIRAASRSVHDEDVAQTSEKAVSFEGRMLRNYSHSFMSPELSDSRREYLKIVIRVVLLIIVLMWTCLPIYWASMASSAQRTHSLLGWVIDRDQARLGSTVRSTFLGTSGPGSIGWTEVQPANAGDDADIAQAIISEEAWIAVVVETGASNNLLSARQTGNTSYDPTSAITMYYAQARNEVVSANFLVPITTQLLLNSTQTYATSSAQRYLATIISQDGSVNTTAINLIAQAPQTMAPAVSWKTVNVRPYTAPVAQAVTLVGQIYIFIFAFMTSMAHATARAYVEPYLTFPAYLSLRLVFPLIAYLPLSLSYSMISLPFHLPFGTKYGEARGFFLFFAFIYLGMCALGLALEAGITLFTPRFIPFFLVMLIIVNISTAALPVELQPGIFAYGIGFPVLNLEQAIRTIIFNTNSHLGQNTGVLIAWTLLSCGTLGVFTWIVRRIDIRRAIRSGMTGEEPKKIRE